MGKQFDDVSGRYGAPMGRAEWREPPTKPHSVRVFRVRLDSGGYDDGGAYWGLGKPLYCATDGAGYRMFTRAETRMHAIAEFRLAPFLLRAGCPDFSHLKEVRKMPGFENAGGWLFDTLAALGYGQPEEVQP